MLQTTAKPPRGPWWAVCAALVALSAVLVVAYPQLWSRDAIRTWDHLDFYLRVQQYGREILNGHWPQVLPDALLGAGHAFPRFYPPVSHFVALGLSWVVGDVVLGSNLSALLTAVLSAITMFLLVWKVGGRTLPAVLAAMAYSIVPYRFVTLNFRGAIAESWAFVWYPLLVLGLWRALTAGRFPRWWPLAVAGLLCSHTVMGLWVVPAILSVVLAVPDGRARRAVLLPGVVATLLGGAVAAFYLLPMAYYLPSVRAGDAALVWATSESVASKSATLLPGAPLLEAVLVLLAILVLKGARGSEDRVARLAAWCFLIHAGFLALSAAPEPVWRWVPEPLRYIQFGWRLTGPAIFFGAAALGIAGIHARSRLTRYLMAGFAAGLAVLGVLGGRAGRPTMVMPGGQVLRLLQTRYAERGFTVLDEYLPRGSEPASLLQATQASRASLRAVDSLAWQPTDSGIFVRLHLDASGDVALPLVAYDFYRVDAANGRKVLTGSRAGQLTVYLPAGAHDLRITRRLPVVVLIGFAISLAALCTIVGPPAAEWARLRLLNRRSPPVGGSEQRPGRKA